MVNSSVFELVSRSRHVAGASTTWDDEYYSTEGLSSSFTTDISSRLKAFALWRNKGTTIHNRFRKVSKLRWPPAFPLQNQRDPLPFVNFQIGKNKNSMTT